MKRSLLALTLSAALPFAASAAEGVSYNYVEGGYASTDLKNLPDADGFAVKGSVAFHPNFHVFGDYANQEFDNSNLDFDQWRLGVGYNHQVSPRTDLLTRVAYEKIDFGSSLGHADGWSVEAGARAALTNNLEGYALAGYQDGDDVDGDFYGRLGATVKFNQNWGISGDVKLVQGGDRQWFVGPRFSW